MSETIARWLTRTPFTVGKGVTLAEAHRRMREHGIRHLPVLDGGSLVGLVSLGDLHLLETLRDVDPETVLVEEAMSQDPFVVHPDDELADVAEVMAHHKYGSVVAVDGSRVVGIFTAVDGLRILSELLRKRHGRATTRRPKERSPQR